MFSKYPTLAYGAVYTIVAMVGLSAFFYICNLLGTRPALVPDIKLVERVARAAYTARTVSIQYTPECGRYDQGLTYLLRPGQCTFQRPEYDVDFDINSSGLRDSEESLDRPAIVMLGDSHTMGLGVAAEDSFPNLIEQELELGALNAGISSYGTAREMMLLRRLHAQLDLSNLDYVIVQYCQNDESENLAYMEGNGTLDTLSREEYREIVQWQEQLGESPLAPGLFVFRRATEKAWDWLIGADGEEEAEMEVDAFVYAIEANRDLLEGKHVIVLELNDNNVSNANFIDRVERKFANSELDLHFLRTSDFLTDEDYYMLDTHMKPSGHRKVAAAIVNLIHRINGGGSSVEVEPLAYSS